MALTVQSLAGVNAKLAAVYLKEQMEAALPPDLEELLDYLEALRPKLKATIPQQGRRAGVFRALFRACMAAGRPLEQEEVDALLALHTEVTS